MIPSRCGNRSRNNLTLISHRRECDGEFGPHTYAAVVAFQLSRGLLPDGEVAFLAALSLATERMTETIKGLPILSRWIAVEKANDSTAEEFREASIHILAIAGGTLVASLRQKQLSTATGMHQQWLLAILALRGKGQRWVRDVERHVGHRPRSEYEKINSHRAVEAKAPAPTP